MSVTLIVRVTLIDRFSCTWIQGTEMFTSENAGRQIKGFAFLFVAQTAEEGHLDTGPHLYERKQICEKFCRTGMGNCSFALVSIPTSRFLLKMLNLSWANNLVACNNKLFIIVSSIH